MAETPNPFKKAEREQVKLKLALTGPSGSGKTLAMLALARQIAPEGKIAVLDTENGSASLYSDQYDFDVVNLAAPFTSARYIALIKVAHEAGYDVLGIDSLSHQWAGAGGVLARKEEADARPNSNSYTNWAKFTKEHEEFKAVINSSPIHIICCMRTKADYVLEQKNGKSVPRKIGMAPIQREGFEYEFSAVFDIQMDHRALVAKHRMTALFPDPDELFDLVSGNVGTRLMEWLRTAKPVEHPPMAEPAQIEQVIQLADKLGKKAQEHVEQALLKGLTVADADVLISQLSQRASAKEKK